MKGAQEQPAPPGVAVYSSAWRGGSGWFVQAMTLSIAANGGRVTMIAPEADPIDRDPRHPALTRLFLPQGTGGRGHKLHRAGRNLLRIAITFPLILKARWTSTVFVVTMTDWLVAAVLQFVWIRLLGASLIHVVHDVTPHAWAMPNRFGSLERGLLALTYRLPTALVTLTENAKADMLRLYPYTAGRVHVIAHGAYVPDRTDPAPGNGVVLLFGMLRRNKRILEALQAFAQLPADTPLRLVIAGAPHDEDRAYWDECSKLAGDLGDRVRTEVGFVPEARVAELLAECDAVVLPYEEFTSQSGVAILATFAERTLISTDAGGIGELVHIGLEPVFIARPVTACSVSAALQSFAAMSVDERRARASRSRARLASALSWDVIGRQYMDLIRQIAVRPRSLIDREKI